MIRQNRPLFTVLIGGVIVAQSLIWTYVRMQTSWPNNQGLSPVTLRGFDTKQGLILTAGAALLFALCYLIVTKKIKANRSGSMLVTAIIIVFLFGVSLFSNARDTIAGGLGALIMGAFGATAIALLLGIVLPDKLPGRRLIQLTGWVASFVALAFAFFEPIFGSTEFPAWVVIGVYFALLGVITVVRQPFAVGVYRMVIYTAGALLAMSISMSTSLRFALQDAQIEASGAGADIGVIQIDNGVIVVWIGFCVALVGTFGLLAQKREDLDTKARARRQQEVAAQFEDLLSATSAASRRANS